MKHIFITALMTAGITLNATAVIGPGAKEAAHARMDRVMRESGNIFKDRRHDTPFLQKGVRQAPAKMVNVDFSMADDEGYSLKLAVAIDKNTGICEYYADGNNWGPEAIPSGEYDFLFWGTSNEAPYYYCMYGDENVILNEDRDYVLDFSKCTEMVKFESTLPDGSRGLTALENFDSGEILEEGNLAFGIHTVYVFVGKTLIDWSSGLMDRGTFDDGWSFDNESTGDVLVNPGLTAIALVQYRELVGNEDNKGIYYSSIPVIPARGGVYTNAASDYAHFYNPVTLPAQEEFLDYPALYVSTIYNGRDINVMSNCNEAGYWPATDDYWVGSNEVLEQLGLDFYPCPAVIEGRGYGFSSSSDAMLGVLCNPIINKDGELIQLATTNTFNSISTLTSYNSFVNWPGENLLKANTWFTMSSEQKKIETGNSVPILVPEQCWYSSQVAEAEGLRSVLYHNYKGRNGEGRTIDFLNETVKVSINGVEQDLSELPSIHLLRIPSEERYGIWDIEFINNNCYVDGERGLNAAKVHFNDSGNDVCAPTLQMLQTLDADNNVTDKFATPADGRLIFAGGDFTAMYDNATAKEWFDINKCDILVECAPTGTDSWQELECVENSDRFMMPGWGYYWEASLESLQAPATDTRYDVRITLTDAVGNYQQQTLTPVFTITGTSGVTSISTVTSEATYYNLQGVKIKQPTENGIYIEQLNDGSSRKVMIKL